MRYGMRVAAGALLVVGLMTGPATGAFAKDGDVVKRGSCTAASDWKLKASPEHGAIEVEFEVDSNVVGQSWNVKLIKNGTAFFTGTRTTKAPSGSFEVRRVTSNPAGTDTIKGKATNPQTGERCVGALQFSA